MGLGQLEKGITFIDKTCSLVNRILFNLAWLPLKNMYEKKIFFYLTLIPKDHKGNQ